MLRRSKRLILVFVAATAAMVLPPPSQAVAMSPCQAKPLFLIDYSQTIAVAGAYTTAGAASVWLTCGIVRDGITVARFSEKIPGPVAAVAGTATVWGTISVCHEITATYLDGRPPYVSDYCP